MSLTVFVGCVGSGKTACGISKAVELFKNKYPNQIDRVKGTDNKFLFIYSRSNIEQETDTSKYIKNLYYQDQPIETDRIINRYKHIIDFVAVDNLISIVCNEETASIYPGINKYSII